MSLDQADAEPIEGRTQHREAEGDPAFVIACGNPLAIAA